MGNFFSSAEDISFRERYGSRPATYRSIRGNDYRNDILIGGGFSGTGTVINAHRASANSAESHIEILQCLFTSNYQEHRNRIREPVEGTCTWVTEHAMYERWLEQTSGLLWLSGDPGYGKSVIASFLVRHLNVCGDAIVCYFFFKDDSEEQRSATFALCAILHQLFSWRNSLCRYADEAFKVNGKRFTEDVRILWDILVSAVADSECGDVICVVDALDECEEETQDQLVHHMTRLPGSQASNIPLKFLVTSRPYGRIERGLGSRASTIRLKLEDGVNDITADVTRVIDEGIKTLESYWGQPGELGYLRNLLESSADRTFFWISLVLEILKDSENGSREEFTHIASTLPRDIAGLYTGILDRCRDPEKTRQILHIVVAAVRPLTLREMNVAFRVNHSYKTSKDIGVVPAEFGKTVRDLCGLFLRVIDSKIYLVHQTAREFLVKGSLSGLGSWQYTLCPKDSNLIMADACIAYLSLADFEHDPLVGDGLSGPIREEVSNYLQKYDFLRYAASHWADHFRKSQNRQMELFERTRLICEGGSNRFLTWFRVYWVISGQYHPFPNDFTHLMIASWLGQGAIVELLLKEGRDVNARSEQFGTALNIAALQKDKDITGMLVRRGVKVYIGGKEYSILHTKKSELAASEQELAMVLGQDGSVLRQRAVIAFLGPFCIQDIPDLHTRPTDSMAFFSY